MLNKRLIVLLITILGLTSAVACRSRKHSAKIGADALKIIVTLKNIDDVNKTKLVALEYQMNCGDAAEWSLGDVNEDNGTEVAFLVKRASSEQTCQFRVLDPSPPSEYVFLGAQGVVYEADAGVKLSKKPDGQLAGEVLLNRKYKLKAGNARVKAKVHFKAGIPSDISTSTAELKCSPEFQGIASGLSEVDQASKQGFFIFESGLTPGVEYACRQLQVSRGKQKNPYYGKADFKLALTTPGEDLITQVVEMQEIEVVTTDGLIIIVTPGEACKQGEVFDVVLGKCIPKPD